MKIVKHSRDKGFWITPLIAIDTNLGYCRFWFAWLFWLFEFDINNKGH